MLWGKKRRKKSAVSDEDLDTMFEEIQKELDMGLC